MKSTLSWVLTESVFFSFLFLQTAYVICRYQSNKAFQGRIWLSNCSSSRISFVQEIPFQLGIANCYPLYRKIKAGRPGNTKVGRGEQTRATVKWKSCSSGVWNGVLHKQNGTIFSTAGDSHNLLHCLISLVVGRSEKVDLLVPHNRRCVLTKNVALLLTQGRLLK